MSVRCAAVTLAWLLAAEPAGAAQSAAAAATNLPVSISRIREGLKRPEPRLSAPPIQADYRVSVDEKQRFEDLLLLLDFSGTRATVPGGWNVFQHQQAVAAGSSQPLVSVNAMGALTSTASAIVRARRERAERLAREEVERALIDYCSTHECPAR